MESWKNITRTLVTPEEIDIIMVMDAAWMKAVSEHRQEAEKKDKA